MRLDSAKLEPHIDDLLVSAQARLEVAWIASVFDEARLLIQPDGAVISGDDLEFHLFEARRLGARDARLGQGAPDAEAPVRLIDADAEVTAVAELRLRADLLDAGGADDPAVDLGEDLDLVLAVGLLLQEFSLLFGGIGDLVGIGEQKVRLLMRRDKDVQERLTVGGDAVAQDTLPAVLQNNSLVVFHLVPLVICNLWSTRLYAAVNDLRIDLLGDHRGADLGHQRFVNRACRGVLSARLPNALEPRGCDLCRLGRVEHRALGDGDDRTVMREAQLELLHRRLEVMLAVREAAAADHQIFQTTEVRLTDVLIAVADLLHRHGRQRQDTVEKRLERRGHPVAVERIAPDQQVAVEDRLQYPAHIVVVDTGAAVAHTTEASSAVFDMLIDRMDDGDVIPVGLVHPLDERAGDVHGVALVPLRAAVEHQYLHPFTSGLCAPPCAISAPCLQSRLVKMNITPSPTDT